MRALRDRVLAAAWAPLRLQRGNALWLCALGSLLLGIGLIAANAQAQNSGVVVVVRVAGDERIVQRLRAELRSQGWRVIDVSPRGDAASRPLDTWAGHRGAEAVLRAQPRQLALELWVDRDDEPNSSATELITASGPAADAGVLALRAAEALRARGLGPGRTDAAAQNTQTAPQTTPKPNLSGVSPLSTAPPTTTDTDPARASAGAADTANAPADTGATPTETSAVAAPADNEAAAGSEPTPATPKPAEPAADGGTAAPPAPDEDDSEEAEPEAVPEPSTPPVDDALFYLELAPAVSWSPGGFPPRFDAWGDVRVQILDALSVSVFVSPAIVAGRVQNDVHTVSALVNTLVAGGAADLRTTTGSWELSGGLGAAALITWLGDVKVASAPPNGQKSNIRTPAAVLRFAATTRMGGSTQLFARVLIGYALPEPHSIGFFWFQPRKYWGEPFLTFAVGLRFALPGKR